jgi:hypothetical protein
MVFGGNNRDFMADPPDMMLVYHGSTGICHGPSSVWKDPELDKFSLWKTFTTMENTMFDW